MTEDGGIIEPQGEEITTKDGATLVGVGATAAAEEDGGQKTQDGGPSIQDGEIEEEEQQELAVEIQTPPTTRPAHVSQYHPLETSPTNPPPDNNHQEGSEPEIMFVLRTNPPPANWKPTWNK